MERGQNHYNIVVIRQKKNVSTRKFFSAKRIKPLPSLGALSGKCSSSVDARNNYLFVKWSVNTRHSVFARRLLYKCLLNDDIAYGSTNNFLGNYTKIP